MTTKICKCRFYLPDQDRYKYFKIEIKPSLITNAGRGAFATEFIPQDSAALYRGVRKSSTSKNVDYLYSWELYEYDKKGNSKNSKVICYIDCTKEETGNWTRFANCGSTEQMNNLEPRQYKENMYYVARRDIQPGEELYINYGPEYCREYLNITYETES